jgi:hypothetical protein
LGGFDATLDAVWNGLDGYPGIEERWSEYSPWLDRPGLLVLYYDEVMGDLKGAAEKILDYSLTIKPQFPIQESKVQLKVSQVWATATDMVASALDTDSSPTFRRGVPGEWQKYKEVVPGW